jgi:hypothetical protein
MLESQTIPRRNTILAPMGESRDDIEILAATGANP